jgi:hypothetical protein
MSKAVRSKKEDKQLVNTLMDALICLQKVADDDFVRNIVDKAQAAHACRGAGIIQATYADIAYFRRVKQGHGGSTPEGMHLYDRLLPPQTVDGIKRGLKKYGKTMDAMRGVA